MEPFKIIKVVSVMFRFFMSVQFRMNSRALTFSNILNQSALKNFLDALI